MPIFTPSRRWQPAYRPFKKCRFSEQVEEYLERTFKGFLWGCRMCGNCLLQETAFICPMACPKGLRNGPCGGSTPDHCCVDDSRPCIWYEIYSRVEKMSRLDKLLEVLPPLDWDKTGTSALRDVYKKVGEIGFNTSASTMVRAKPQERLQKWDQFFMEIRQPNWWNGDALPHPVQNHEPVSNLEKLFSSNEFVITCELVPPISNDFSKFDAQLIELKDIVDAVNITDSASAIPRMSPISCAIRAIDLGIEPILQMAARDRTRLSFQADLLGASASGVRNLLLITGDHPNKGNPPFSKMDIWDYDSVQAAWIARKLRDERRFLDGRSISNPPTYFIGAAASPNASQPKYQAIRVEKKLNVGAQFFQTNLIFDINRFEAYLEALDQRNLLNKMHLIAGVTAIRSMRAAKYMNELPGIQIPDILMNRLSKSTDIKREGFQICLEGIEKLKSLPGIQGIHFMAVNNVHYIKKLIDESGIR